MIWWHGALLLLLAYLLVGLLTNNGGRAYNYKLDLFLDLFLGAAVWCEAGVTISSEVGLAIKRGNPAWWARALNAFLNWLHPGHCAQAILDDTARAKATIAYLEA